MPYETLIYEKTEGIAIVTLNRPNQMNSINTAMQNDLKDILKDRQHFERSESPYGDETLYSHFPCNKILPREAVWQG